MDCTSSSEEVSSSECDSDSSGSEELENIEVASICGNNFQLPQGLCENREIFNELFSVRTWNSLSEVNKQHLKNFLPSFPENDETEKNATLQMLLTGKKFRFNNPLSTFFEQLQSGYYRPDISDIRKFIKNLKHREYKYQQRLRHEKLLSDVVLSRQKLLLKAKSLPPGVEPKIDNSMSISNVSVSSRVRKRYFQELAEIKAEVGENDMWSEDENFPEGPLVQIKRQRKHINGIQLNSDADKTVISTLSRKNLTGDNTLPFLLNEDYYKSILAKHKRKKLELNKQRFINRTAFNTKKGDKPPANKLFSKIQTSPDVKSSKKRIKTEHKPNINSSKSPESRPKNAFAKSANSDPSDCDPIVELAKSPVSSKNTIAKIKQFPARNRQDPTSPFQPPEPPPPPTSVLQETSQKPQSRPTSPFVASNKLMPATLSDLDGIDMMNLPIDIEDPNIDILNDIDNKPELMQETHANFLSLIRDIICSTSEHRMTLSSLEDHLKAWQENPISPLNDWYSLVENWVVLLPSAIAFLSGEFNDQPEDFVPYIEHKPLLQMYQWIGAGRDSDNHLSSLCQYWLTRKDEMTSTDSSTMQEVDVDVVDKPSTPPPPRWPTTWTVRKAEPEEIEQFREQERRRYENPHKAFTYKMNGFESVVGPIKGIYNQSASSTKARGHSLLTADRPNFVTILTLVRDATARLPNGEGTRADICELLKCSQYISDNSDPNVLQSVVSGALDRMHTEYDPCVKYDTKRKIWIYLHRNRTEADFERIHQQYQGMSKNMKKGLPRKPKPSKPKPEKSPPKQIVKPVDNLDRSKENHKLLKVQKPPPKISILSQQQISPGTSLLTSKQVIQHLEPNCLPDSSTSTQPQDSLSGINESQGVEEVLQTAPTKIDTIKPIGTIKTPKGFVKIISPIQAKAVLNQSLSNHQQTVLIKQVDTKNALAKPTIASANLTQQILQTIANQQKQRSPQIIQIAQQKMNNAVQTSEAELVQKTSASVGEQAENISAQPSQNAVMQSSAKPKTVPKILNVQQTISPAAIQQLQKQFIQQNKGSTITSPHKTVIAKNAGQAQPLVAKVLTNAAGQVISVESILAHQKQGTLPQGATLKIANAKPNQSNLIQISGNISNQVTQFTVVSQNNVVTLSSPIKANTTVSQTNLAATSSITNTLTKPIVKTAIKPVSLASKTIPAKSSQSLVAAKFITAQNMGGQKLIVTPQNQIKINTSAVAKAPVKLATSVSAQGQTQNTIRMVNAANLNLAHISGKPVLLTNKGNTIQNIQGQSVILQNQTASSVSNSNIIIQNTPRIIQGANIVSQSSQNTISLQSAQGNTQVMLGTPLKVQNVVQNNSQIVIGQKGQGGQNQTMVVGNQAIKVQSNPQGSPQRVVLTNQGGQLVAQQILLPPGFQGGAINIKTLQGLKVIPLTQAQGIKGIAGKQSVLARIMSPVNISKPGNVVSSSSSENSVQSQLNTDQ